MVTNHLSSSFPEMSDEERKEVSSKFYQSMSDIFIESMKGPSLSYEEIMERFKVVNPEVANRILDEGRSVVMVSSHQGNWEWGALCISKWLSSLPVILYKRMSNKYIDEDFRKVRAQWGTEMCPSDDAKDGLTKQREKPVAYILISDQSPVRPQKAFWVNFFNKPTGFVHGFEMQARRYNHPVIFFDMLRVKKGYYEMRLKLITENPKEYKSGQLTALYAKHLEDCIKEHPEQWLWTHNRWKKLMPEGKKLVEIEETEFACE
ncbi:KDO2-lipid IV(A) lauroyltransferase [Aureibacter tunicatorum]|uniref:KDO2-lipid IV(A) lauroyltransferase n=2 Tax=Aureibacter tunicatorum TaxID=866807 RepID=A0AAE4BRV0_9BACT|nr:KDO2-lipid IV(A) lauroyltransferase [Aureibacter tunicatorum]